MKIRALALFRRKDVHEKKKKRRNNISFAAQKCVHPLELLPPSLVPSNRFKKFPLVTTNPNLINTRERKRDLNLLHHLTSNSSIFVQ